MAGVMDALQNNEKLAAFIRTFLPKVQNYIEGIESVSLLLDYTRLSSLVAEDDRVIEKIEVYGSTGNNVSALLRRRDEIMHEMIIGTVRIGLEHGKAVEVMELLPKEKFYPALKEDLKSVGFDEIAGLVTLAEIKKQVYRPFPEGKALKPLQQKFKPRRF